MDHNFGGVHYRLVLIARWIIKFTVSFVLIGMIFISGCLAGKTRKISSANACPIFGTLSKSIVITLNLSRLFRILRACDLETCIPPMV